MTLTERISALATTIGNLFKSYLQVVALTGTAIDWDSAAEFTKTLSSNTTLTDTDLVKGKVIVLWISGNYSITFPAYYNKEKGSEDYDGTVMNKIVLHCKETSTAEVWYYITQEDV